MPKGKHGKRAALRRSRVEQGQRETLTARRDAERERAAEAERDAEKAVLLAEEVCALREEVARQAAPVCERLKAEIHSLYEQLQPYLDEEKRRARVQNRDRTSGLGVAAVEAWVTEADRRLSIEFPEQYDSGGGPVMLLHDTAPESALRRLGNDGIVAVQRAQRRGLTRRPHA